MDKVEVSLEKAMGTITLKESAVIKPEHFKEAIKKAGFTPTWMKVQARGVVAEQEGNTALKVSGNGQSFMLMDNNVLKRLRDTPGLEGKDVIVTGSVEGDDPVSLRLETFEVQ